MPILTAVKGLLTYKEPQNIEGFELLEDECEDGSQEEQVEQPDTTSKSDNQMNENKAVKNKALLKVGKWKAAKGKQTQNQGQSSEDIIVSDLNVNIVRMKKEFNIPTSKDVVIREFRVARKTNAFILYLDGMINKNTINDFILRPLMNKEYFTDFEEGCLFDYIADNVLSINQVIKEKDYENIVNYVLNGITAIFVDGCEECLIIEN